MPVVQLPRIIQVFIGIIPTQGLVLALQLLAVLMLNYQLVVVQGHTKQLPEKLRMAALESGVEPLKQQELILKLMGPGKQVHRGEVVQNL